MSVDFSAIIDNFLSAELGEDVRGSLVAIARALEAAINSQLTTVTTNLGDTDPNTALQAKRAGDLMLKYWESPASFRPADIPVNSFTYVHPASNFSDKPEEIDANAWISVKKENLTSIYGAVCLLTVYDTVNNITYRATYRSSDQQRFPWNKVLSGTDLTAITARENEIEKNTLKYWNRDIVDFGADDMPANTYTYVQPASDFTDKPAGIADDAYINVKKENLVSSDGALCKITVFNPTNNITYITTYRKSTQYGNKLYPWRKVLKSTNNRHTVNIFKKVLCVGDSYTEGYINTGSSGEPHKEYSWPHYMEQLTGNEWINCGISGATTLSWLTDPDGLAAAKAAGHVQAYVIGLMINDAASVPVGYPTDIDTDNQTYYGGLSKIIRELNAISPLAKIFVTTCPTGAEKTDYQKAVRDICEAYKDDYPVYLIDLKENADMYAESSFSEDRINNHHTALGYEQMAEIYVDILSEYIDNHVSEFQNVYQIPYTGGEIT